VDEVFTFAHLTIGLADRNQAVVPLGGTGEAIELLRVGPTLPARARLAIPDPSNGVCSLGWGSSPTSGFAWMHRMS
jgi:hypothetical protein